jgi:DNA (cytosine-5)-methyltransferase 1
MSDHCTCGETKIGLRDVVGKAAVTWMPSIIPTDTYFIRQKYNTEDNCFTTLNDVDLNCRCGQSPTKSYTAVELEYRVRDTVLVADKNGVLLEPAIIVAFQNDKVKIRELLRRARDFKTRLLGRMSLCGPILPRTSFHRGLFGNVMCATSPKMLF